MIKLNLGSGRKRPDGFLNVDLAGADVNCDIRSLPFPDDYADEIMAIHVCEHFYVHEIIPTLVEWRRVLKPGGMMALELPCLDKVLMHFAKGSPENFTLWPLYGDPNTHKDGEPALHKWSYTRQAFYNVLVKAGFVDMREETPHYHQPSRDMRWVAYKPVLAKSP